MKDVVSPVPPDEVRQVIRKCLDDAALVNYTRICNDAKIERRLPSLDLTLSSHLILEQWSWFWDFLKLKSNSNSLYRRSR